MSVSRNTLSSKENIYYRDQLRIARYAALADAEGFEAICWALESLGRRLNGSGRGLSDYKASLRKLVEPKQEEIYLGYILSFDSLFEKIRGARNDAAHTGAYARHATSAAIELALILEGALMKNGETVADFMIKDVVVSESWHFIAQARNAMLKNSFSYLPLFNEKKWWLISDLAIAKYILSLPKKKESKDDFARANLATPLSDRTLQLIEIPDNELLYPNTPISEVLNRTKIETARPWLWLVVDKDVKSRLLGVLSPFELL